MVKTKDDSRIGRDYLEVGKSAGKYFSRKYAVTARREEIDRMLDESHNRRENDSDSICDVCNELRDGVSGIAAFDIDKYRKFIRHVIIYDENSIEVVWNIDDPMAHFQ